MPFIRVAKGARRHSIEEQVVLDVSRRGGG